MKEEDSEDESNCVDLWRRIQNNDVYLDVRLLQRAGCRLTEIAKQINDWLTADGAYQLSPALAASFSSAACQVPGSGDEDLVAREVVGRMASMSNFVSMFEAPKRKLWFTPRIHCDCYEELGSLVPLRGEYGGFGVTTREIEQVVKVGLLEVQLNVLYAIEDDQTDEVRFWFEGSVVLCRRLRLKDKRPKERKTAFRWAWHFHSGSESEGEFLKDYASNWTNLGKLAETIQEYTSFPRRLEPGEIAEVLTLLLTAPLGRTGAYGIDDWVAKLRETFHLCASKNEEGAGRSEESASESDGE